MSGLAAAGTALDRAGASSRGAERSLANRDVHRALYLDCDNPLPGGTRPASAAILAAATAGHPASWERQ